MARMLHRSSRADFGPFANGWLARAHSVYLTSSSEFLRDTPEAGAVYGQSALKVFPQEL